MAIQPELGVLAQRRPGVGRGDSSYSVIDRTDLDNRRGRTACTASYKLGVDTLLDSRRRR
jgi:hypothetical protein